MSFLCKQRDSSIDRFEGGVYSAGFIRPYCQTLESLLNPEKRNWGTLPPLEPGTKKGPNFKDWLCLWHFHEKYLQPLESWWYLREETEKEEQSAVCCPEKRAKACQEKYKSSSFSVFRIKQCCIHNYSAKERVVRLKQDKACLRKHF